MEKEGLLGDDFCRIDKDTKDYLQMRGAGDITCSGDISKTSYKKIDFKGIRLLYGKLAFTKPVPLQVENSVPYIEMYFSLSGSREMHFTQSDKRSTIKTGKHNVLYIPDTEFYIEPSEDEEENISLQIQFTQDYFMRFMPAGSSMSSRFIATIKKGSLCILSPKALKITPEMYGVLNDIVHCNKEGVLKQLFLETNILKLLLLQFEQFETAAEKKEYEHIKKYDIEKLQLVKTLLEENISHAHSLTELSRKSGLNDFKLKKGFKELFGTTVFSYLHELRMENAKTMLYDETKSIAEIAGHCGYLYVQSFTTAFKNKYGITPEKFRK